VFIDAQPRVNGNGNYTINTIFLSYPAGMVTIGNPSVPPVSIIKKRTIRKANVFFEAMSRSSI
jgi:hypothetical protein